MNSIDRRVIGNKNSKIYHLKDCYCIDKMDLDNKVAISLDHYDEKKKSYRPCAKCVLKNSPKFYHIDNAQETLAIEEVL